MDDKIFYMFNGDKSKVEVAVSEDEAPATGTPNSIYIQVVADESEGE